MFVEDMSQQINYFLDVYLVVVLFDVDWKLTYPHLMESDNVCEHGKINMPL